MLNLLFRFTVSHGALGAFRGHDVFSLPDALSLSQWGASMVQTRKRQLYDSAKVVFLMSTDRLRKYSVPRYTPEEAAHYVGIPVSTFRSGVFGRYFPTANGRELWKPIINLEEPEVPFLSFFNLVEAHVLSSARSKHKVPMPEIREALEYVKKEMKTDRPLLDKKFSTDGKYLF